MIIMDWCVCVCIVFYIYILSLPLFFAGQDHKIRRDRRCKMLLTTSYISIGRFWLRMKNSSRSGGID
jgi:hypothetical protein